MPYSLLFYPRHWVRRRAVIRLLSSLLLALAAVSSASGSTALLRANRKTAPVPAPESATTYLGKVAVVTEPVKPDTALTVAWLADTFDAAARDAAHTDLLALYAQAHGRPLRLAVLHGGAVDLVGPFTSRTQLERAVAGLDVPADAVSGPAVRGPVVLDTLNANIASLGSRYSAVLLVGTLPKLDERTQAFAESLLASSFAKQQVRVFLESVSEGDSKWASTFESSGGAIVTDVHALPPLLDEVGQSFLSITWAVEEPLAGFVVCSASIHDADTPEALATVPELVTTSSPVPTVEQFISLQRQLTPLSTWLREPLTAANLERIRTVLVAAQALNAIDPDLLKAEASLGIQTQDAPYALKAASYLVRLPSPDGPSFALLGKAEVLSGDFEKAEAALDKAAALNVPAQELAEPYMRVHLGRRDERGALPYLAQALEADGKRRDLWLLQAQTAEHLKDLPLAIQSYERELALGGTHLADSGALLRLYVETKDTAKAHTFAAQTVAALPADTASRVQFAQLLDEQKLPVEGLAAWKAVLAVQPNQNQEQEQAHVRVAQLLLETGDVAGSEAAAEASLQSLPQSGALYLTKSEAIRRQGRIYDARSTLEEGAAGTQDPAVLTQLALAQEVYGDRAPEAYSQLAGVVAKGSPERFHALERGFSLSLRDGNLKQASSFAASLEADGHPEFRVLLGEKRAAGNDVLVPGGLEAFGFVARVKPGTPPDRFFAEYSQELVRYACPGCGDGHYASSIQNYFSAIAELEAQGTRTGNDVSITLSTNGKDERNKAQNVLRLLGLQMHTEKGELRLDRGEKQSQSKKQDLLTALQVDELGMQDALQAGKPFTFTIHDEPAPVYPSLKMWKDSFPKTDMKQYPLMLLKDQYMARLYLGFSTLDRQTVQALIGTSGLYFFLNRPADLLMLYGTSFAVDGKRAAVPGGAAAGPVWSQMVGASTEQAGTFYQALLQQQNPTLLTFFYAISHLDVKHQAFFTANLTRMKRFYALFCTLPESQMYAAGGSHESTFSELLSQVPLDDSGHVAFPGSPEVWTIAKGTGADDKHVAKLLKQVSRAASADVEDEVLLQLAGTRYKTHAGNGNELDNFLAVSRIDAHRKTPMDEESALMLAQNYSAFSPVYPFFTDLPAIDAAGFRSFFTLVNGIGKQPSLERNLELGQLNSLIEWVVLIQQRQGVDDAEAARLFRLICDRMGAAVGEDGRALASIDLAQAITEHCAQAPAGKWDDTVRGCLLGQSAENDEQRGKDFQIVLDEQKVPGLNGVRAIVLAAKAALEAGPAAHVKAIVLEKDDLPGVALPKDVHVSGKEKDGLLLYDPTHLQKLVLEWNENAAKSPQNAKTSQKLAGELLRAVEPQVTLALAGSVYAYFFRSTDLVVSADPLLLRKHRYFDFDTQWDGRTVLDSTFVTSSDGLGSHLAGSFGQFGLASGFAVASGWKQGGRGGPAVIAEQIAALRGATWELLRESDQRLVTLRILAAREWIVAAAQDPKAFASLSEETSGLISISRRADLLNGIVQRDWQQVWTSITLPDLFRLGGNYLARSPQPSPVVTQLRAIMATNDGSRLDVLGRVPNHLMGCDQPHLVFDAPYEAYERQVDATYIAERSAEFKLFLAYRADSLGVMPAELPLAAERLAAKAFKVSQMSDYHDWRALLTAYASITNANLKSALEP